MKPTEELAMRSEPQRATTVSYCWCAVVGVLLVLALGSTDALAQSAPAAKPKVPPGTDPGGIAIALIGFGIDYTDSDIAPKLARDGEGEIIGWDFIDGDNRPYASALPEPNPRVDRGTTHLAKLMLAAYSRARLVPIRIKSDALASVMQAVAFAAQTPARTVALPMLGETSEELDALLSAARLADMLLFVVPQRADAASTVPKLANVVRVMPAAQAERASAAVRDAVDAWIAPRGVTMFGARRGAPPASAAEAVVLAAAAAACAQHERAAVGGAAAKAGLLALATEMEAYPGLKVIDPLCLYGGQRH